MIRLKIDKILEKRPEWSMYKLHIATGIRPNTVSDMVNNKAKQWSPENLEKIARALNVKSIDELVEYIPEEDVNEN